MEKIYELNQTIQRSDSDCWAHWIEDRQISLHASLEGAEKKIQSLLKKEIDNIPKLRELNPHIPEKHWKEMAQLLSKNRDYFTEANNGGSHAKYPLYTIKEITIED